MKALKVITPAFAGFDVPAQISQENAALVQTTVSLVSAGTEKMLVDFANRCLS